MNVPLKTLLEKYLANSLTEAERWQLQQQMKDPASAEILQEMVDAHLAGDELDDAEDVALRQELYRQVEARMEEPAAKEDYTIPSRRRGRILSLKRWPVAAAALLVLLMGSAIYIYFRSKKADMHPAGLAGLPASDIAPGGRKAMLTLADGRTILLDSAANGIIAREGNTQVLKPAGGQLVYRAGKEETGAALYNTVSTPRGGEYRLTLPDGSQVWLNAASSIRYPTVFNGKDRKVEITGEAYFEIAPSISSKGGGNRPFIVQQGDLAVMVLGTHFNVNAYPDEPVVKTTLLEGRVKVSDNGRSELLEPGQQAQMDKSGEIKVLDHADLEQAVAWKNGVTAFRSADIRSIMRQVARWYDVEVVYEAGIPHRTFTGGVSRNAPLSQLLRLLEVSKIHFRVEGKKIIVEP